MTDIACVDLFCGVGGLTWGLQQGGVTVKAGVDLDRSCGYAFTENTGVDFLASDATTVPETAIQELFPADSIRLLAGCAPCQPFSTYGQSRKTIDTRWDLLNSFSRLISSIKPELVTLENVPGLARHDVFKRFLRTLTQNGYLYDFDTINCALIGIPQTRRRLVLAASRLGPISLDPLRTRSTVRTVRETIAHLPLLTAGAADQNDPLHAAAGLSPLNLSRIRHSTPGGTWRDWPDHLLTDCHKEDTGKTYSSVYGRMEWDKPAPTMTTQCYAYGSGRFGHPEQNRAISLREAALLQTFPEQWRFSESSRIEFSKIGRLIGNAVPPELARRLAHIFVQHTSTSTTHYAEAS